MSDESEDPFEKLDESVGDRDGDPFERLAGADEKDDSDQKPPAAGSVEKSQSSGENSDPSRAADSESTRSEGSEFTPSTGGDGTPSEPSEYAETTEKSEFEAPETEGGDGSGVSESAMTFGIDRREPSTPGEGPALSGVESREGNPFENVEKAFAEMEVEQLDPDSVWQELTSAESRGSVGAVSDRGYAEVSKHSFCEQCEHFSEPPAVHCAHEGTEIVEFVDMETVRVVDCPIVAERAELENE